MSNEEQKEPLQQPLVTCRCRKKIIEYWVAETPDGREVEIRGIKNKDLKDGMMLTGELKKSSIQDRYSDGSFARSYTIEEWLQVINGS